MWFIIFIILGAVLTSFAEKPLLEFSGYVMLILGVAGLIVKVIFALPVLKIVVLLLFVGSVIVFGKALIGKKSHD